VDRRGADYRLGPRLHIGGGANVTTAALVRAAGPVVRMLAEETGETAILMRRVGVTAVCLDAVEPPKPLRVVIQPGAVHPLHLGATPRVLLAYAPPEVLEEVLLSGQVGGGDPAEAQALRDSLADIVAAGVARSEGDFVPGIVTIAVPIIREDGIAAALGVSGPETRCGIAWRTRVVGLLPRAARTVATALAES
jgi:IclR family KDG regulon transcriptional repressor